MFLTDRHCRDAGRPEVVDDLLFLPELLRAVVWLRRQESSADQTPERNPDERWREPPRAWAVRGFKLWPLVYDRHSGSTAQ